MTKLQKLAGWLPAVGAMIFNSCVIGWLPVQRAAFSVPGHAAAGRAAVCADSAPASLDSKTELAKQLAAYELAMLGVPDGTEATVQPLDEDRLGYYSVSSR